VGGPLKRNKYNYFHSHNASISEQSSFISNSFNNGDIQEQRKSYLVV